MILNAINNLGLQDELLMIVSGFKILEQPENLEKILKKGQKMRLITTAENVNKETIKVIEKEIQTLVFNKTSYTRGLHYLKASYIWW